MKDSHKTLMARYAGKVINHDFYTTITVEPEEEGDILSILLGAHGASSDKYEERHKPLTPLPIPVPTDLPPGLYLAPYRVHYRWPFVAPHAVPDDSGDPLPETRGYPLSHFAKGPFCQCVDPHNVFYSDPLLCCGCEREIQSCDCEECQRKLKENS